jgi:hypothetical protein
MADFDTERRRIDEETDRITDPLARMYERQRRTRELLWARAAQARATPKTDAEQDADVAEAIAVQAECIAEIQTAAGNVDTTRRARKVYHRALHARKLIVGAPQVRHTATAPVPTTRVRSARPRGRRERHVARATSSSDSGSDDGPSDDDGPLARLRRAFRRARGRPT